MWTSCVALGVAQTETTASDASKNSESPNLEATPEAWLNAAQFALELERTAKVCGQFGLGDRERLTLRWLPPKRPDQALLYLPVDPSAWLPPAEAAERQVAEKWSDHFKQTRSRHAAYLSGQLPELAEQNESEAYRLLWRVQREDPDNQLSEQTLGNLLSALKVVPRVQRGRAAIEELGWSAGSYQRLQSPHFRVLTRADLATSRELALQLEQFYALWTQAFYAWWAPPGLLVKRLEGRASSWPRHEPIEVVLLSGREEYLRLLGVSENRIDVSVGYYNPEMKKSFFYPDAKLKATLFHELTHQLLMEATRLDPQVTAGQAGGIWILEGIALYMESLQDQGGYWTLGGWESPRMQTARYRGIRDSYWPAWEDFTAASLETWKTDADVARLYTHAAGLSHLFMDGLTEQAQGDYLRTLAAVYQGELASEGLLTYLGADEALAQAAYRKFLQVTDEQLAMLRASGRQPRELVLCGSQLAQSSWHLLSGFEELAWLDLSFSNVTDDDLDWLDTYSGAKALRRLSVEGTQCGTATLRRIARLPQLEELDLSGCQIGDQDLKLLAGNRSLRTLWLTQTQISEVGLETLASLPNLRTCDVTGTQVSKAAWQAFLQKHPQLANPD